MKSKSLVCKLLPILLLVLVLSCVGVSARQADDDSAHVFVFNNLEGDEPAVAVWLDDKVLVQDVQTISNIIERTVAPGEYSLTVTENGTGVDTPLFDPIQATFE